jgi:hypothetical protein
MATHRCHLHKTVPDFPCLDEACTLELPEIPWGPFDTPCPKVPNFRVTWDPISNPPSQDPPLLPPRAYHINQGAIDVCNELGMQPADAIVWLKGELGRKKEARDLQQALEDAFRKVAQAEGVMLHAKQKEFFKDLFGAFLAELKKGEGKGRTQIKDVDIRVNR